MEPEESKRQDLHRSTSTAGSPELPKTRSQTPPINRLPFDIFQIITTLSQEEAARTFPFILSHVSRLWREHVLSMPLLWNSLHIIQRVPQWEMLEAKLERSGQAPLDIYIDQPPFMRSAIPHLRKIMRMIFPHIRRWRTLHLDDAPYKVRRILLDQIRAKSAPLLQEIRVFESSRYDPPSYLKLKNTSPHWNATNVLTGFLNLDSVIWTGSIPDFNALPTFRTLRKLTIGDGTGGDIFPLPFVQLIHRVLPDSPSLEALTIYHCPTEAWRRLADGEATNLQLPPLTHHSLQRLFIGSSDKVRSAAIRTLILPKLRALSTIYYTHLVNLSCSNIIARENSLPELRVISLVGDVDLQVGFLPEPSFRSHMPFLRPAIQNLTNLRVLTFRAIDFDDEKWLPDLGSCCPHLRWLLFVFCTGFTIPSIRLIVETRIHADGINPLEILCIQPLHYAPPEDRVAEEDAA
ncbi:hypothetical protein FRC04_002216 [Tulasnella sp. 424]|nr:hypothetical protein FRC04_002216 [Tulasnella sp. 424]KAG8967762.1 hypothetical protein FRC05_001941 [Tulasnella sp. 425]